MRRLTLKKDTLAELTTTELTGVAGAAAPTVNDLCGRTFTLTCWSAVDACLTAQIC